MSILIAGRQVLKGDSLYHRGFESWGTVSRFDPSGSAELVIKGRGGIRKMLVLNGGYINEKRQVFWHEPITIDLPLSNVSAVQRVVDVLAKELSREDK